MENIVKHKKPLGQLLIDAGKITEEQLLKALEEQRKTGKKLGHTLVEMGYITEDDLVHTLEKQFGIPCITITPKMINSKIVKTIPENICRKYTIIPILLNDNVLTVATTNPYDLSFIDEINFTTDYKVEVVLSTEKSIMDAINTFFGKKETVIESSESGNIKAKVSAVKMLDMIFVQAYNMKATEIQLELFENNFNVLFVTPKTVVRSSPLPIFYYNAISLIIRNKAGLDTIEKNKFQEGIMRYKIYDENFIIRVLIFPTPVGENIVLKFP